MLKDYLSVAQDALRTQQELYHVKEQRLALALDEFLRAALQAIYLLNGRYAPFYKWLYRGALELPRLQLTVRALRELLQQGLPQPQWQQPVQRDGGGQVSPLTSAPLPKLRPPIPTTPPTLLPAPL